MVKVNFEDTKREHLDILYRHLSVQSLLDIKSVNGEVSVYILKEMFDRSINIKSIFYNGKLAYCVFVLPTDENEFSIYLISTTLGYSEKNALKESFESIIRDLPKSNYYSIVYKGNHKFTKLLRDNGFVLVKNLIHGVEKRMFFLLEKKVNAKRKPK